MTLDLSLFGMGVGLVMVGYVVGLGVSYVFSSIGLLGNGGK